MKYSTCCAARAFNVGGWKREDWKCSRCFKKCNPLVRGSWKDPHKGK